VYFGERPTFRRNISPPSSGTKSRPSKNSAELLLPSAGFLLGHLYVQSRIFHLVSHRHFAASHTTDLQLCPSLPRFRQTIKVETKVDDGLNCPKQISSIIEKWKGYKEVCWRGRRNIIIIIGVRLSPLGTAATIGLLYQLRLIHEGDCGAIGGIKIGGGNRSTRRKPDPVPLCSPQIPHNLTRAGTRAAAAGSQRITA
jgi:hypothetical protein